MKTLRGFRTWVRRFNLHVRERGRQARDLLSLLSNYWYDIRRAVRWTAAVLPKDNRSKRLAQLIMSYHTLEKGLSLRSPRPGFGGPAARILCDQLERLTLDFGWGRMELAALGALEKHCEFNAYHGSLDELVSRRVLKLRNSVGPDPSDSVPAGTRCITKKELYAHSRKDLSGFFATRCSIRQFTEKEVPIEVIQEAVRMAQKSPSVCNRQAGRVCVITDATERLQVLEIQGGSRGFAEEVEKVLIVSSELGSFQTAGERNQCWVDGGLFAMSLVYALHSLGVATCCLSWGKDYRVDKRLRALVPLPLSHAVVLLIAVGYPPEEFRVAQSARKPIDEVMLVRGGTSVDRPPARRMNGHKP